MNNRAQDMHVQRLGRVIQKSLCHQHHHHGNVIGVVVDGAVPNKLCVGNRDSLALLLYERTAK
jgi:hypothetical protein